MFLLSDLVEEVKALWIQNAEKDKQLAPDTRLNDRALTADTEGEPGKVDVSSTEQQVAAFLQSKGIDLNCDNIEACHLLPRRNPTNKPAVIIRFVNRKHKNALLKQGRKLRGSDVFINEHLTKNNAEIARRARYLKKQKKIQNTWTANCRIFIKLNGTPEEAKVLVVSCMEELEKYQ